MKIIAVLVRFCCTPFVIIFVSWILKIRRHFYSMYQFCPYVASFTHAYKAIDQHYKNLLAI